MQFPNTQFNIDQPLSCNVAGISFPVIVTGIHHSRSTVSYDVQTGDGLLLRMIHGTYLTDPKSALVDVPKAFAIT